MQSEICRLKKHLGALALSLLIASSSTGIAAADTTPTNPTDPKTPVTVSADALPTVQVNGVVWQQAVIGNTVYAAGKFDRARPAGSAVGSNEVTRSNLLAYNLDTGTLQTTFVANLNAQAKTVTASPDGSRLYVGGDFSTVNGVPRRYLAALDPVTGAPLPDFAPSPNHQVKALAATADTVYLGGSFTAVNGHSRSRLAAVTTTGGLLSAFAPVVDGGAVQAMVISPEGTRLVVGGSFTKLNGSDNPGYGLGQVDTSTGASLDFAANSVVRNAGPQSAVLSLSSDGTTIYGTGYVYGSGGNLEGAFAANWSDTRLKWLEDCHGDSYGVSASSTAVYVAGHPHSCLNIGGFGETTPKTFYRAVAFSQAATGTVGQNLGGSTYYNFVGNPSPSLQNWFPDINAGTYTGQSQGPWTVTAAGDYVLYGGEFTAVNSTRQQGLVRFATRGIAPNKQGPRVTGSGFQPTVTQLKAGVVKVSWPANWDRDTTNLTYTVYQDDVAKNTATSPSLFWNRRTLSYTASGVTLGSHSYRVSVKDPFSNIVTSPTVSLTVV
ncbi:MAG TPA: hypothetical protein VEQ66_08880 [Propionibacteriaceae bacterium]|nr:hypothetical protein [Propionibacteriaceae bacterium]